MKTSLIIAALRVNALWRRPQFEQRVCVNGIHEVSGSIPLGSTST
jgi:hypothetical protein